MCTSGCFQNGNNHFSFLSPKYIKSFRKNNTPIAFIKILIYIVGVLK